MEEKLFNTIQREIGNLDPFYDLRLGAPLWNLTHPRVLSAVDETSLFSDSVWSVKFYATFSEAQLYHAEITNRFRGLPFAFKKFLDSEQVNAIVDFESLGAVVMSRNQSAKVSETKNRHKTLAPWVTYALSPELWGPSGKWTRFHERLHTLFEKYHLLQGQDSPGFYPLKSQARVLEKHGFIGSVEDGNYVLYLNWTFPLSGLKKLEEVVSKEF